MYKKILAAVNEHLNSEISARYALSLAMACNAKLYLCFIADKDISKSEFGRAEDAMKRLFIEAEDADIQVESITETGAPVVEIDRIVRQEGIDIVFAATRREDVEKRFFSGTTARRLSLTLPCSVALVRVVHMGRMHPKKIMIPLKGEKGNITEMSYFVAMLASTFKSKMHIFHVTKPITKFFHGEVHLKPVEWEERFPKDIDDFIEHLNRYNADHEKKLAPGSAGRRITLEAAAKRHDLIIMGASGRNLIDSLLKGNPVEEVLRDTPCNLIILKSRHNNR